MGSVLRLIVDQSNFFTKVTGVAVSIRALSEQAKITIQNHSDVNRHNSTAFS
jgi:hypothetical protein